MGRGAYDMMGLATPQTLADVRDEQVERQRRRDVAEANREAYDAAQDNRLRPGRISSFSADGDGNFSRTESIGGMTMREDFGADYDNAMMQRSVYDGMNQLAQRGAAVKRHNANLGRDSVLSAMKISSQNGGRFPSIALGNFSRNLGMDGKSSAIGGAGFAQNGDFVMDILSSDGKGGIARSPQVIKPRQQYDLMLAAGPGAYSQEEIGAFRQKLMDNYGYADRELPAVPNWNASIQRGAQSRQAQAADKERAQIVMSIVKDVMGGKGANKEREVRMRLLTDRNLGPEIMRGKPMLDKDGNQQMDDEGKPMYEPASDEEVRQKMDRLVALAMGGGTQGEDSQRMQNAMALLDRLYPQQGQPTPEEREIRQRQLTNAVEDQRRADVARRPQQLIHYTDADGTLKVGNGWIRDGKVFDSRGYEIEGATPMTARLEATGRQDANGRDEYETRYEQMSLPPARDLAGGGAMSGQQTPFRPELRNDGKTYKGTGWLGVLRTPDGAATSEYTVGVNIDGKEMDIPTLVPGLTQDEIKLMVNDVIPNGKDVPESIMQKAVAHARSQLAKGESVFANDGQPPAQGVAQSGADAPAQQGGVDNNRIAELKAKKAELEAQLKARRQEAERLRRRQNGKGMSRRNADAAKPSAETAGTGTNANMVASVSGSLRKGVDRNFSEPPVPVAERRAQIMKYLKEWQTSQNLMGENISDEEVERMVEQRLKED